MSIKALLIDLSLPIEATRLKYLPSQDTTQEMTLDDLQQALVLQSEQDGIIQRYSLSIAQRLNRLLSPALSGNNTTAPSMMGLFHEMYQEDLKREFNLYWINERFQKLLLKAPKILLAVNPIESFMLDSLKPYPLSYISHARNTHYLKPSLPYYAEILARSTLEPDEVLMVYLNKDVLSPEVFERLGISTWNITNDSEWNGQTENPLILYPDAIIAQLQANMSALYGLLDQVEYAYWQTVLIPKEWTIAQNLAHLAEKEIFNYRPLILKVLQEADVFISEYATSLNPLVEEPYQANPSALLEYLLLERLATLALLKTIDDELWGRIFQHSVFGTTTLLEMVYFIAQHDRMHIRQICQLLQKCM